jgi:hypothetical protein
MLGGEVDAGRFPGYVLAMTDALLDQIRELHQRIHRDAPPPANELEERTLYAMSGLHAALQELILERMNLDTVELSLFYFWLRITTLSHGIAEAKFKVLAGNMPMVMQALVTRIKEIASGIRDAGPTAEMRAMRDKIQAAKDIIYRSRPPERLPRDEITRQAELTNGRLYHLIGDWLTQEVYPGIIERVLLYHWFRTSTINANVSEEFFQKIERNWPEVADALDTFLEELSMPGDR